MNSKSIDIYAQGRVNVTCVARVFSVYVASSVLLLDEERPQIAPVMGSRDSNTGNNNLLFIMYLLVRARFSLMMRLQKFILSQYYKNV